MEPQCIFCDDSDDDPGDNLRTPKAGIDKIKQYGRLFPKSKVAHRLDIIPEVVVVVVVVVGRLIYRSPGVISII